MYHVHPTLGKIVEIGHQDILLGEFTAKNYVNNPRKVETLNERNLQNSIFPTG
jgi:hypothetical protein